MNFTKIFVALTCILTALAIPAQGQDARSEWEGLNARLIDAYNAGEYTEEKHLCHV